MIYLNGSIGSGKTSLTKYLSDDLGTKAFYEKVADMPMLNKFYSAGEESRYELAFPLQVAFLNYRYKQLREGLYLAETQGMKNTVYDSSLLSDRLMAGNLYRTGQFPQEEYDLYLDLAQSMQANVSGHPFTGYPDLVIYLDMSFDTMLEHIQERDRDMEKLDDDKVNYFHSVWEMYRNWATSYGDSAKVTIDMDKVDYVHSMADRIAVLEKIEEKLHSLTLLSTEELEALKAKHEGMLISSAMASSVNEKAVAK